MEHNLPVNYELIKGKMEQVRKALSRAKTAFGIIENSIGLIDNELGHVSPGREIYEIDLALKELEQSTERVSVDAVVMRLKDELKDYKDVMKVTARKLDRNNEGGETPRILREWVEKDIPE